MDAYQAPDGSPWRGSAVETRGILGGVGQGQPDSEMTAAIPIPDDEKTGIVGIDQTK